MVACLHTINLKALHIEYVCSKRPKSALRYLGSNWGLCKCQHIYHVAQAPHCSKPQQRIYLPWVCVWIRSFPKNVPPSFQLLSVLIVLINTGGFLVPFTEINLDEINKRVMNYEVSLLISLLLKSYLGKWTMKGVKFILKKTLKNGLLVKEHTMFY